MIQPPQASPHRELRGWVALQGCPKQGEGLGLCVLDQSGYGSRQGSCLQLRVFLERLCPRRAGTSSPVQKGGPAGGHTVNQVHSAYLVGSRGLRSSRQGGREGGKAGPGLQGHGSEASHLPSSQAPGQNSLTWLHPPAGSCSVDYERPRACWKPEASIRERDGQSIVPGTDAAHPEPRRSVHP